MDWSAKLFGLGESFYNTSGVGGGVIQVCIPLAPYTPTLFSYDCQTTASDSCLVAVVAARARYMRLHPDAKLEELVVLTTTQTHSLGSKAALVLGLKCRSLPVKAEDQFALRGEVLRQALEEDKLAGLKPFIISKRSIAD
jgi:aromatic-L-amino-acid/L-tryptophan decarboxylase